MYLQNIFCVAPVLHSQIVRTNIVTNIDTHIHKQTNTQGENIITSLKRVINIFRVTWPLVQGIHQSPVNSPRKGQWHGALMFSLFAWTNGCVNNRDAGYLRRHHTHYDVTVMSAHRHPSNQLGHQQTRWWLAKQWFHHFAITVTS